MIIGLTGTNAAGKGTVAAYLQGKGFAYYSLSDELRALMKQQHIPETRENFISEGTAQRSAHGTGYLAQLVKKKLQGDAVVDSIRNMGEVEELRTLPGFVLIAVDAPPAMRYERSRKRGSERDEKNFEEFRRKEALEMHGSGAEQQLAACTKAADVIIMNDSTPEKLYKKLEDTLKQHDSQR
jgi:dephospho-CoA kinase